MSNKRDIEQVYDLDPSDEDDTKNIIINTPIKSKKKKKRETPEHDLQTEFTTYRRQKYPSIPAISSLSGVRLPKRLVGWYKDEGLEPGYPDYMIFVTKYDSDMDQYYSGLFIEFKAPGRKVRPNSDQAAILKKLHQQKYCVRVINDINIAKNTLDWYMKLPSKKKK